MRDDANTVRVIQGFGWSTDPAPLPPADMERLPNGEVRALPGTALGGYTGAGNGQLVYVVLQPLYQDGVGWVYDPPARGDTAWTNQELVTGKTLTSRRGASTVYQVKA